MKCPAYGDYSPCGNPFGTGFYHGWQTGVHASEAEILKRYPDMNRGQLTLYLNGRDDGVKRDTWRIERK